MSVLRIPLWISLFVGCVLCYDAPFESCNHTDIVCLRKSVAIFYNFTSVGIPELGIKQVEPLVLNQLVYDDPESDMVVHLENIKITGLKDTQLNDLQMDSNTKIEVFQSRMNINIEGNLTVEFKEAAESLSGPLKAKATGLATATFAFEMKPNSAGVDEFNVGPETITCEQVEVPEFIFNPQLVNGTDAGRANYQNRTNEIKKEVACTIFTEAYKIIFKNVRAATKVFPKTAFFSDF